MKTSEEILNELYSYEKRDPYTGKTEKCLTGPDFMKFVCNQLDEIKSRLKKLEENEK